MAWSPENSAIRMDKSLEEKLAKAENGEVIKEIMRQAMLEQGLVTKAWDESILEPVEQAIQPRRYARTVIVQGQKHVLESASEQGLDKAEAELLRQIMTAPTSEQPRHPETGRFTAAVPVNPEPRAAVDSAAVEEYLRQQGISPDALKEVSGEKYKQKWEAATQEFLQGPGSSWIGGESNKTKLGETIFELGLADNPSVESLKKAYEHMQKNGLLSENPQVALERKIAECNDPEELRALIGYRGGMSGSSLWGR